MTHRPSSGWHLRCAQAINRAGIIVSVGTFFERRPQQKLVSRRAWIESHDDMLKWRLRYVRALFFYWSRYRIGEYVRAQHRSVDSRRERTRCNLAFGSQACDVLDHQSQETSYAGASPRGPMAWASGITSRRIRLGDRRTRRSGRVAHRVPASQKTSRMPTPSTDFLSTSNVTRRASPKHQTTIRPLSRISSTLRRLRIVDAVRGCTERCCDSWTLASPITASV